MARYSFPGYSIFLRDAARQIGRPEAELPARRITTLGAIGNLCAQAGGADPAHAPAILAKAAEFRDQLLAAYKAAELMIAEVNQAVCGPARAAGAEATTRQTRPGRRASKRP